MSSFLLVSSYLLSVLSVLLLRPSVVISYDELSSFHPRFPGPPPPFADYGDETFLNPGKPPTTSEPTSISKCPDEHDRKNSKTGECHAIGTMGPCRPFMIFSGNENLDPDDKIFGHCKCDDSDSYDRPLVFVGEQCHFIYTQASCPKGYWLIASGNLGPVCKPNPCESKMSLMTRSRSPEIYFRGECVKLRSPSNLCDNKDEIVMFAKGSLEPTCEQSKVRRRRIYKRQISKVNALKCQAGTIWSRITHKCRPVLQAKVIRDE